MICRPGAGHAAAGRLARVVAPAAFHAGRMLVGEIAFDMHHLADNAVGHHALELAHRGKAALVVAEREGHAGLLRGGDGARGFRARERQRLLAPDRLAGRRHRGNLLDVQRMRRCQEHRLHARIGDRFLETGGEFEAFRLGEIGDQLGLLAHPADEMQALALALHGFDDVLAPASEADHGGVDHEWTASGG